MLKEATKAAFFVTASAVGIPYTIALMCNLLWGWPLGPNKYQRALHPRKVYALNYAVLLQFMKVKYARLSHKWWSFYKYAPPYRVLKDITYGRNENKLDLYFPSAVPVVPRPVVVFLYGGAWGTGSKNMYGLLASELADSLQAVVICPNYSTYPKGYVDDMIQDVVDCLIWLQHNATTHGADKERVMLIGHSAGAHLAMMATLELTLKRLMHNPNTLILPDLDNLPWAGNGQESMPWGGGDGVHPAQLMFEDTHFKDSERGSQRGSAASNTPPLLMSNTPPLMASNTPPLLSLDTVSNNDSFFMVQNNGQNNDHSSNDEASGSFYVIDKNNDQHSTDSKNGATGGEADSKDSSNEEIEIPPEGMTVLEEGEGGEEKEVAVEKDPEGPRESKLESSPTTFDDTGLKEVIKNQPLDESIPMDDYERAQHSLVIEDDDELTFSQREFRDLLNSIKCVIGLAGVYDITDHYEHEAMRGIEDISAMGRAMYGPESFARFSPTEVLSSLPKRTRLPPMVLMHGTSDYVVPPTASDKYGALLADSGGARVSHIRVPGCDHYDICLDLMDKEREYYDVVMAVIKQQAQHYL